MQEKIVSNLKQYTTAFEFKLIPDKSELAEADPDNPKSAIRFFRSAVSETDIKRLLTGKQWMLGLHSHEIPQLISKKCSKIFCCFTEDIKVPPPQKKRLL